MKTHDIEHPSVFDGRPLMTVGPESHVGEALVMMSEKRIHHLPVLEGGIVVGLISDRDILLALAESQGMEDPLDDSVGSVMRRQVPTIDENTEVREVLKIMREQGLSALPIVERGRLTGILTETDMLRALEKVLLEPRGPEDKPLTPSEVLGNPLLQRVVHFLGQSGL